MRRLRRGLTMRPKRRKYCPTWGLTSEGSWLRWESGLHMITRALWRFLCPILQETELHLFPAGRAEARKKANCKGNQEEDSGREAQATGYWALERGWPEVSSRAIKDWLTAIIIFSLSTLHHICCRKVGKTGQCSLKNHCKVTSKDKLLSVIVKCCCV